MQALFGICLIFVTVNVAAMEVPGNVSLEILGGTKTSPDEFKFVVAVLTVGLFGPVLCTGTVLSHNTVLTAGRCIDGWMSITVLVNCTNVLECTNKRPGKGFLHPKYQADLEIMYDIGYVETYQQIGTEEMVELASADDSYPSCTAVGYGATSKSKDKTDILLYKVEVKNIAECSSILSGHRQYTYALCAYIEGGKEAIVEVSGGPLLCGGKQVGITSQFVFFAEEGHLKTVMVWALASKGTNLVKASMSANLKLRLLSLILLTISFVVGNK